MHYPTREQPVVGLPKAAGRAEAHPHRWYVVTDDAAMSLRLVPGAVLCEGIDGELVPSVDDALHAARFDIVDGELWVTCLAGELRADDQLVTNIVQLESGTHLMVGTTSYLISNSLTEMTGPVPVLVNQAYPAAETTTTAEGARLFYEEPTEVEEITIMEPAARPHLVAAKQGRTGDFPTSLVPDAEVPPADNVPANVMPMAPTQFFKTPTLRVARSKAKSRLPATTLMLLGLLAAVAYAATQFVDRQSVIEWWESRIAGDTATHTEASNIPGGVQSEPYELIMAAPPPVAPKEAVEEVTASATDPRFDELTTYAWLRDVNKENHARFLLLAQSLLSSENTPPLMEHVEYYATRMAATTDRNQLEALTTAFGRVFAPHAEYRPLIAQLETRILALNENSDRLAELNRTAAGYFSQNALTLPPGNNVVSVAQSMLALDDKNSDALHWLSRTADVMVQRASDAATSGDTFAARNLIEDVLAFAPAHAGANALWLSLSASDTASAGAR